MCHNFDQNALSFRHNLSQLMRFWHLSPSVNSVFNFLTFSIILGIYSCLFLFLFDRSQRGFDSIDTYRGHHNRNKPGSMDRYGSGQGGILDSASALIHTEPVVSLATIQPGLCISGSKDKVLHIFFLLFFVLNF